MEQILARVINVLDHDLVGGIRVVHDVCEVFGIFIVRDVAVVAEEVPKLADGSGAYAKTPDKTRVFTVASFAVSSLDKKPFDLRDRDLLHVKRDGVKTLEVAGPEGSYGLAKDDKSEWAFTRPLRTLAGRWSVDGLLGSIEGLRMESVAAEDAKDLKKHGLDKPTRTVTLGLADGTAKTLEIGCGAGRALARGGASS